MTREELVSKLAEVSHSTWLRQKERDQGADPAQLSKEVHQHDIERAEDIVNKLVELEVVSWNE
jgi:hypothetical protein